MQYTGDALKIIPIKESLLPQVLQVYRQCEDFLSLGPAPTATMEMVKTDIEESKRENGIYSGIEDGTGKLIGIVDYVPCTYKGNPRHAFISLIMIAAAERDKGYGKKSIAEIEARIREDGQITAIFSAVQTNNERAIKFWKEMGYKIVSGPEQRPDSTVVYRLRKDLQ